MIRSLDPDLVLANVEENLKEHVETLRRWSIPVFVQYPRTVAEGIRMVEELGALTGGDDRAGEITAGIWLLYHQAERLGETRKRVGVFSPIWRNPYMTINRDTYVHDMLTLCSGRNVFAERPERYPQVTLDEVAAAGPEVILLPDEPYRFRKVHVQDFAPYEDVPAVRDGRIYLVDGKLLAWYGPRIGEALQALPPLLHL